MIDNNYEREENSLTITNNNEIDVSSSDEEMARNIAIAAIEGKMITAANILMPRVLVIDECSDAFQNMSKILDEYYKSRKWADLSLDRPMFNEISELVDEFNMGCLCDLSVYELEDRCLTCKKVYFCYKGGIIRQDNVNEDITDEYGQRPEDKVWECLAEAESDSYSYYSYNYGSVYGGGQCYDINQIIIDSLCILGYGVYVDSETLEMNCVDIPEMLLDDNAIFLNDAQQVMFWQFAKSPFYSLDDFIGDTFNDATLMIGAGL